MLDEIPAFVARINDLVKQIEEAAEAKILVMRVILGAAVIATLLVVILSIYLVNNILVHPLRDLLGLADQIGQGNLAVRTDLTGEDEIGRLGQAFNHMAEDLSKLYQNLEARVEEKTAELTIANRSLELLYHSIARLYNGPVAPDTYAILLKDLENVLGVGHGLACLVEAGEIARTGDRQHPATRARRRRCVRPDELRRMPGQPGAGGASAEGRHGACCRCRCRTPSTITACCNWKCRRARSWRPGRPSCWTRCRAISASPSAPRGAPNKAAGCRCWKSAPRWRANCTTRWRSRWPT